MGRRLEVSTWYGDWIREHESETGYGWAKYRLSRTGTTRIWLFGELDKFRELVAQNADDFMWAMTFSITDGAFYYNNGEWRQSSGARLAFFRDKAAGKVYYKGGDKTGYSDEGNGRNLPIRKQSTQQR